MKDIIVTKEELAKMFIKNEIVDTNNGWSYKNKKIEIIAIHEKEPKYLLDLAKSDKYKLRLK